MCNDVMMSCISPVDVVVGPVRDEHRRGVESHAAMLERWYATDVGLRVNGSKTDLRILATAKNPSPLE
jgi:hypothetical protein